ncbi:fibronectin type III domain-containing protein [Flavobacterium sp. SM2513]|uniref:fibronectin type III domain-containing protein n=1 Tax=Flavobacterium sp. SM2513 TaxID=3424766 RepID=UPI003D7FEFE6
MLQRYIFLLITLFSLHSYANEKSENSTPEDYINFVVEVGLNGHVQVNRPAGFFGIWAIEYGPQGFVSGTGTVVSNIYQAYKLFIVNPFYAVDFRVRVLNGSYGPWSQAITANLCNSSDITVGYNYDFDNYATETQNHCWRGYTVPDNSNNANIYNNSYQFHGESGKSIALECEEYSNLFTYFISPKIADLSTDKKITFWLKNYNGSGLKVGTVTNPYDPSTFHILKAVQSQGSNASQWQKITIYLNNYNNVDDYIMFKFYGTYNSTNEIYIDDFTYEQSVNCFAPQNLVLSNIGENTVQVDFDGQNQELWEVAVKNMVTQEIITSQTTNSSFLFDNLLGNTQYELSIRAICSEDHFSEWTILAFTTVCENKTTGYTTSFGDFSILDPCWKSITSEYNSVTANSTINNGNDLILLPHSGSKLIKITHSYDESGSKAYLVSPYLADLNSNKRIKFFSSAFYSYSSDGASLIIGTMSNPNNSNTFQALYTIPATDISKANQGSFAWKQHIVYLNNISNNPNNKYIAFKHGLQITGTFAIDDFTYEEIPSCTEPSNLTEVNTTYNSATLKWNTYANATATEWEIEYGITGFTQGTGTTVTATSNPFTISNINGSDTNFDFYVRSKCGTDFSAWSDKGRFWTKCFGMIDNDEEGFENYPLGSLYQQCWSYTKPFFTTESSLNHYDIFVTTVNSSQNNNIKVHTGNQSVRFIMNNNTEALLNEKVILVSPRLVNLNNYKNLSFWLYAVNNPNEINIGTLSNPADYNTFTPFSSITNAGSFLNAWKKYTIDLSAYSGTDEHIGIRIGAGNGSRTLYFDDFKYEEAGCPTPNHLKAVQSGTNGVSVAWTDNNNANPSVNWSIEYGPVGFTNGTLITTTTNPFVISGLTIGNKYEFRVRNNCTESQTGNWSNKYAFLVSCSKTAPYEDNFNQFGLIQSNNPGGFCWTSTNYETARLITYYKEDFGINTISTTDYNNGNNAIRMYHTAENFSQPASTGYITSPFLADFDSSKSIKFNVKELFYQNTTTTTNRSIIVGTIANPLDIATFVPYQTVTSQQVASYMGKEFIVNFENYAGTNKHIAFLHNGQSLYNYLLLDNIKYFTTNPCIEPTSLNVANLSDTEAVITWDEQPGNNNYELEYGVMGFLPGTGTILTTTTPSIQITNLLPNTAYQCYLKAICSENSSNVTGLKKFVTTCEPKTLPWEENFNQMSAYGVNILPNCFKAVTKKFESRQSPLYNYSIDYDNVITGIGDTHFIFRPSSFFDEMYTPMFHLLAGTTYKFRIMARKGYEYSSQIFRATVGTGNNFSQMKTTLNAVGEASEYQYQPIDYYYTPLVTGDYSYNLTLESSGGGIVALDKFSVKEGYNSIITNNNVLYDFEGTLPTELILESSTETLNEVITYAATVNTTSNKSVNKVLKMNGNIQNGTGWKVATDIWAANEQSITKVNFKIDATQMTELTLKFNLKQTFYQSTANSAFRIIINGNVFGTTTYASNQPNLTLHQFNLNEFAGQTVNVSLQHIGKSLNGNGDNAYLDNIRLIGTVLSNEQFETNRIKIYPNPTTDIVRVENLIPDSELKLINVTGQELFTKKCNTPSDVLDLSMYPTGLYFLNIKNGNRFQSFKIIKQ